MKLVHKLMYIIFPKRCYFCNEVIAAENKLCEKCSAIHPDEYIIGEERCKHCGADINLCTCKEKSTFYSSIIAPYYYIHPVNTAVWQFKYHDNTKKAKAMAEDMKSCLVKAFKDLPFDYICYVPQTRGETRSRGYNQSKLLALELQKLLKIDVLDALVKIYDTPRQQSLSSSARQGNVFGVFDVKNPEKIEGKNILLIDDIKTTGATLNECAKMLKINNANTITALVFAITQYDGKKDAKDQDK